MNDVTPRKRTRVLLCISENKTMLATPTFSYETMFDVCKHANVAPDPPFKYKNKLIHPSTYPILQLMSKHSPSGNSNIQQIVTLCSLCYKHVYVRACQRYPRASWGLTSRHRHLCKLDHIGPTKWIYFACQSIVVNDNNFDICVSLPSFSDTLVKNA